MATGGFKAAEYIFSTSDSDVSGTTAVANKVKEIVSNVCALIMQCEPHWQYDSNFTPSSSDFVKIGSNTGDRYQIYAQFLRNSSTGSKLCVFYNWYYHCLDASCCSIGTTSDNRSDLGLAMGMIPSGSSNTWDTSSYCTTSNFLPNDGVRFVSTSSDESGTNTFMYGKVQNAKYTVIVKEDVISVFSSIMSNEQITSGFSIGKIFGTLFNSSDSAYYSQYGALIYGPANSKITEPNTSSTLFLNTRTATPLWGVQFFGNYFRSTVTSKAVTYSSETSTGICGVIPWADSGSCIQSGLSNKTSFSPIIIGHASSDMDTYGVVPGVGYKGYLDTDFLRIVYRGFPYGTLLDGGKFIYLGGGLALGWDASNEVILRS